MNGQKSLSGHAALVTGGSSGIGQYTALALAREGAKVIITARASPRLAETAACLKAEIPGAEVETETVDYASFASVRALAARIRDRYPRLRILVNNAGMVTPGRKLTVDGFETLFQVNHLSPFLLTNLLLPSVKDAAPSRIVFVASNAAQSAILDFDDLQLAKGWSMMKAGRNRRYGQRSAPGFRRQPHRQQGRRGRSAVGADQAIRAQPRPGRRDRGLRGDFTGNGGRVRPVPHQEKAGPLERSVLRFRSRREALGDERRDGRP
jgi:NAD(P)-dependent dehydrogenase (short-subunit alcohol dehydrogenase family)